MARNLAQIEDGSQSPEDSGSLGAVFCLRKDSASGRRSCGSVRCDFTFGARLRDPFRYHEFRISNLKISPMRRNLGSGAARGGSAT